MKKESKTRISILISIYTVHFAYMKVMQNFKTLAPIRAEKSVTEISIGENENEQIKGLISVMGLFVVTQYNSSLSSFVPKFRIITKVKSLQQTNKQTNIVTEKAKTIYPLYTSYRGGGGGVGILNLYTCKSSYYIY